MQAPRKTGLIDARRLGAAGAWLIRLIEYGTGRYDRETQRRLKILNVVAYLVALITLIYAIQQMFHRPFGYWRRSSSSISSSWQSPCWYPSPIAINDIAGALLIAITEYIALFLFTLYLGRTSGIHLQYFATPAAFFVIFGLHRCVSFSPSPWSGWRCTSPPGCCFRALAR
jgi:FtsH-binding integral membrane protein